MAGPNKLQIQTNAGSNAKFEINAGGVQLRKYDISQLYYGLKPVFITPGHLDQS